MPRRFRLPLFVSAAAMLGLIALLAVLQYQWLGRISDAERERLRSTLNTRAAAFAQDFDRELTLAFLLFQIDPVLDSGEASPDDSLPAQIGTRFERWSTTARYPRLIKECFVATVQDDSPPLLQRFGAATRSVEAAEWPEALAAIRAQLAGTRREQLQRGTLVVRMVTSGLWEDAPAIVIPSAASPLSFLNSPPVPNALHMSPAISYTILALDSDYITREMLPALVEHHFRGSGNGFEYQLAVVKATGSQVVYHSVSTFSPKPDATTDAAADLFQLRPQEFPQLMTDLRRFTTLTAARGRDSKSGQLILRETKPLSLFVEQTPAPQVRGFLTTRPGGKWRLLVTHPAGSLETAVNSARWKNLLISTSILGILAASMVLLVVSTRRSQELARQQMEFVAAVSHELRTPLAVVRSAGDNLADGLVHDEAEVRKYGDLVRGEGRRLTEMVEQILEFAGIHSGQRTLALSPVRVGALIDGVLRVNDTLIDAARLRVEVDIPSNLPPVAGDEPALRRVFQNLIGNAIKYGADGGWIGIAARRSGSEVRIIVSDRGIGIAPSDHARIFEPFYRAADVVAAQVQGAGLGLSLVHRIVTAHGGRITVKSAKGAGSEFTVHLPIATGLTTARTETSHTPRDVADPAAPAHRPS